MKIKFLKKGLFVLLLVGLSSFTYINKTKYVYKKQGPPDKWRLFKCVLEENGTKYYGAKCEVSVWEDCPKYAPCQKLLDENGDPIPLNSTSQFYIWGFSDEEINNWPIEEPFQVSTEYINTHYNFFISTYNQGITFHPDEIIRRNQ